MPSGNNLSISKPSLQSIAREEQNGNPCKRTDENRILRNKLELFN
jgi:hypothetical protein